MQGGSPLLSSQVSEARSLQYTAARQRQLVVLGLASLPSGKSSALRAWEAVAGA